MCEGSRWSDVVADARSWVADAIASGDLDVSDADAVDRWVHETADGCEHVIYYVNGFGLWSDPSCPVDDDDLGYEDIGSQLTVYAYRAVVHALESAISDRSEGVSA